MTRSKPLFALALAVLLLATSTAGVQTFSADRSLDLAVVSDDRGYVGVETVDRSLGPGRHTEVTLLTLSNRFNRPLGDVDVAIRGDERTPPVLREFDAPTRLGTGQEGEVTATVFCHAANSTRSETWTITIHVAGPDVSAAASRTVSVSCTGAQRTGRGEVTPPGTNRSGD